MPDVARRNAIAAGELGEELVPLLQLQRGLIAAGGEAVAAAGPAEAGMGLQTGQSPGSLFDARATFGACAWRVPLGLQPQGTLMLVLCVSGCPTSRGLFTHKCLWPERPSETATAHKPSAQGEQAVQARLCELSL